ncbi:MAG TPA: cell envelope integrity protein CreD [Thermoanaerobaculia bacterium]|nr:cell envelope integrity protein CreD [Thermoanaerobaculia bacterium]
MEEPTSPPSRSGVSSAIKLVVLGALVLLLLIPVASVLGLVREREGRAAEVREEIGTLWGREQTLGAAVLTLPYRSPEGGRLVVRQVHFLPREVHWQGELIPQIRARGIFEVPVYEARLRAAGWFGPPDLESLGVEPASVLWDRATLTLGVGDLRGIQERMELEWRGGGARRLPFLPGSRSAELLPTGLHVPLRDAGLHASPDRLPFSFELVLRGTETLRFLPLGEVTTVRLASPWPDPGFGGAFLPRQRRVGPGGFTARWEVPYFGRAYPQAWRDAEPAPRELRDQVHSSAFGVTLIRPADQYQQTERSVKYAILFIALTFTSLFLLELLSPVRLHPVQYLLVGFALCLFYVLLLALGEHLGFPTAYGSAAAAIVALVALYARSLLRSWRRIAPLAGTLAALYGYLYSLLVARDHSLLLGATGLFAVLALVMYLTRHLDWWTLRFERARELGP